LETAKNILFNKYVKHHFLGRSRQIGSWWNRSRQTGNISTIQLLYLPTAAVLLLAVDNLICIAVIKPKKTSEFMIAYVTNTYLQWTQHSKE